MGRNHLRDEDAARRRKHGKLLLSSASTVRAAEPLLSLYIQDTVQKGESRDYIRLKQMAVRYLEQTFREKHFSSREGQLEKPASGPAAAKGRTKGGGKNKWETAHNGRRKVTALEENGGMEHDPEKRRESKGNEKVQENC